MPDLTFSRKDLMSAAEMRHSVRHYSPATLTEEQKTIIEDQIRQVNASTGLHLQLILDDPKAFEGPLAKYGKFVGVRNYIALVGPRTRKGSEQMGYYGEKLVLICQLLGLNTCWVGLSFSKTDGAVKVEKNEKYIAVITVGVGESCGVAHHNKGLDQIAPGYDDAPSWFREGVDCVMLAPSAMNFQNFKFEYKDGEVRASNRNLPCAGLDLGIAKFHFDIGSGKYED